MKCEKFRIAERKKIYYEQNKERILQHKTTQCVCDCGLITTIRHKARHCKSNRHLQRMHALDQQQQQQQDTTIV